MDTDPMDPRHDGALFGEERDRFLQHIANQGFSIRTVCLYATNVKVAAEILDLAGTRRLTRNEVELAADEWLQREVQAGRMKGTKFARDYFIRSACRWLQFMRRLNTPPRKVPPWNEMVEAHGRWMEEERGLAPMTIRTRRQIIERFFRWCDVRGRRVALIVPEDLDGFLQDLGGRVSRCTLHSITEALSAFFRFTAQRGWYPRSLPDSILRPRYWRESGLPRGIAWEDVERLITSIRSASPRDIRDRAILLLLSMYGLRRNEIASLRIDDIDWKRQRITVKRPKAGRTTVYPLTEPVVSALRRYIDDVRPQTDRPELFWRLRPPTQPFMASAVTGIVQRRMSEIGLAERYVKAHALRHACATRLLEKGLSLKEIGDHLGHRCLVSTRIYAKVDLTTLRKVAKFDTGGMK